MKSAFTRSQTLPSSFPDNPNSFLFYRDSVVAILVSIVTQTTLKDAQKFSGELLSRVDYRIFVLVLTTWLFLLSSFPAELVLLLLPH